jgi:hypothetical protein
MASKSSGVIAQIFFLSQLEMFKAWLWRLANAAEHCELLIG